MRRAAATGGLTPDGRFKAGKLAGLGMGAAIWVLSWHNRGQSFLNSLVRLTDTVLDAGVWGAAPPLKRGYSSVNPRGGAPPPRAAAVSASRTPGQPPARATF